MHSKDAEHSLAQLSRRWMQAHAQGDIAFLRDHMLEGYVATLPDGRARSKDAEIEALASGRIAFEELSPEEVRVQLYGDTAVLTGQSRVRVSVGASRIDGSLRFTDVWVRTAQGWRAAASHVTPLAA